MKFWSRIKVKSMKDFYISISEIDHLSIKSLEHAYETRFSYDEIRLIIYNFYETKSLRAKETPPKEYPKK